MKNRTYANLANAYNAISDDFLPCTISSVHEKELLELLKAKGYDKGMVTIALENTYAGEGDWDNTTFCETLIVLKATDKGFKWDRVGFTEDVCDVTNVHIDKVKANASEKKETEPKPRKPKGGKGKTNWQKAIDKFAGKGSSVNKEVAAVLRANGVTANGEYWDYWTSIR